MTVLRVNTIAGIGTTTFGPTFGGNLEFNSQNYIVLPKGSSTQQGVLRETVDVVGTGGTFYDNLVLAMPFNQATGLRDVSSRNRNPGAYGDVSISSTISKYYGSSARFDGSGDYLSLESSQDWNFRGLNWTVECWIYYVSGTHIPIYTQLQSLDSNSNRLQLSINSVSSGIGSWTSYAESSAGAVLFNINQTASISTNTWTHVAFVRSGETFYIFKDGSLVISNTDSDSLEDISRSSYIGVHRIGGALQYFNGHIQDLRVYKGIAKYTANFTPPDRIAEVGVGFTAGQLRYNTDSNLPELYDGNQWVQLSVSQVELGIGANTEPGARGVFGGGYGPGVYRKNIDYINISSTGNALNFGNLTANAFGAAAVASSTRGVFGMKETSSGAYSNIIDYVTISSTGDAIDFGDLSAAKRSGAACSSATRGVFAGGQPGVASINVIEYITISATGNAVDFGDLTPTLPEGFGGNIASPVRGIFAGGTSTNNIEFITIATLGNAQDFGDLTTGKQTSGCSNSTRGLFIGSGPSQTNAIEYLTIATLGNTVNFGSLTGVRGNGSACASATRGIYAGGSTPTFLNTIEYVTILTQGNSVDFGDLTVVNITMGACSNAHGGL